MLKQSLWVILEQMLWLGVEVGTRRVCEHLHTKATQPKCFYSLIERTWNYGFVLAKMRDTDSAEETLVWSPSLSVGGIICCTAK